MISCCLHQTVPTVQMSEQKLGLVRRGSVLLLLSTFAELVQMLVLVSLTFLSCFNVSCGAFREPLFQHVVI